MNKAKIEDPQFLFSSFFTENPTRHIENVISYLGGIRFSPISSNYFVHCSTRGFWTPLTEDSHHGQTLLSLLYICYRWHGDSSHTTQEAEPPANKERV